MKVKQLEEIANEFLEEYGMTLKIPIVINNRLRKLMGAFVYTNSEPVRIEIAGDMIKYAHSDFIIDTLKHELIHYALYEMKQPFDDKDQNFINECNRLGVTLSGTNYVGLGYEVKCCSCDQILWTNYKSIFKTKFISNCCESEIKPYRQIVNNGYEEIYTYL